MITELYILVEAEPLLLSLNSRLQKMQRNSQQRVLTDEKRVALMSCHINRKLRSQRKLAMDESCRILIFPPSASIKPGKSRFKKQTHIGGENRRVSSLQHLFQFLISCYSSSYKIQSCNRLVKHTSHKLANPVQAIIVC